MTIQDRSIAGTDLTGVVEDNDLSVEGVGTLRGIILGIAADVSTTDLLDGHVLHVEADVVTWETLDELLVVH